MANDMLLEKFSKSSKKERLFHLLYTDFLESNSTKIQPLFNKSYDIVFLQTKNSLHDIPSSYVAYYVNERNKTLIRLESAYPFSIPLEDTQKIKYIFADVLLPGVEKFKVFKKKEPKSKADLPGVKTKKEKSLPQKYLLYLKAKDIDMMFETSL
jgi:hypothetical protein